MDGSKSKTMSVGLLENSYLDLRQVLERWFVIAQSAQSNKDFINKLEIGLKECQETQYWLELLIESNLVSKDKFVPLLDEANQIGKILVSSTKKLKQK